MLKIPKKNIVRIHQIKHKVKLSMNFEQKIRHNNLYTQRFF